MSFYLFSRRFVYAFFTLLSFSSLTPARPNDDTTETIGSLSARIEDLENQINEGGRRSDDKNPGSRVSIEDLEQLREEIRALRDMRQTSSRDISRLQDEIHHLREDLNQLQKEKANLRPGSDKKTKTSSSSSERNLPEEPALEEDAEVESVLRLLEQSAPGQDHADSSRRKTDRADLESIREGATRKAEEKAPSLPVGDAEAQYNEAFVLYNKGAYKEAERAFDYFLKTFPNDPLAPKALYWKGESCAKQGKHKEAKILFVNAYKKDRKSQKAPHCLLRLGEILAIQGRKEDACTAWVKLKTDFPHMTKEMADELAALKKKHGCGKNQEVTSKPASQKN